MIAGQEYERMMGEKNRYSLPTPLLAAWEFMPKPLIETNKVDEEVAQILLFAKAKKWLIHQDLLIELRCKQKAVVVTDVHQSIQYVNSQFTVMTGYSPEEALGKKPSFLQGPQTDKGITLKISEAIKQPRRVEATIINYRKNQEKYFCKVDIWPLFDRKGQLVNFIAVEQEVAA